MALEICEGYWSCLSLMMDPSKRPSSTRLFVLRFYIERYIFTVSITGAWNPAALSDVYSTKVLEARLLVLISTQPVPQRRRKKTQLRTLRLGCFGSCIRKHFHEVIWSVI